MEFEPESELEEVSEEGVPVEDDSALTIVRIGL